MTSPVLIIDSGVGGFSILKELLKLSPDDSYLYLADQAYFPYGDKDPLWVKDRINELVAWGVARQVRAVVLACNTASVHSLKELRSRYKLPIFGVEPVVKPLASYPSAAILATSSTALSKRTRELLQANSSHRIQVVAIPGLATAIEDMDQAEIIRILTRHNSQLQGVVALGLSCTHYPLATTLIQALFPTTTIVDPSLAVATHVKETLKEPPPGARLAFLTTSDVLRLNEQVEYYLGLVVKSESMQI